MGIANLSATLSLRFLDHSATHDDQDLCDGVAHRCERTSEPLSLQLGVWGLRSDAMWGRSMEDGGGVVWTMAEHDLLVTIVESAGWLHNLMCH